MARALVHAWRGVARAGVREVKKPRCRRPGGSAPSATTAKSSDPGRTDWLNALSSVIVATLVLLSLILMTTTVFPNINVTTFALIDAAVLAAGLIGLTVLSLRSHRET